VSVELIDLRAKISPEGDCALTAYARAHGLDKAEVAREVIHAWALKQMRNATILALQMKAKGISGGNAGASGNALPWDME
jgi:hypothetical protein